MKLHIDGGQVIDGRGGSFVNRRITINDSRIVEITRDDAARPAPGDRILDASGAWILPGLIDCHVHITKGTAVGDVSDWRPQAGLDNEADDGFWRLSSPAARDALLGVHHAAATLRAGFTTVRDLGGARGYADIVLREAIRSGRAEGPRLLACGGGLAMTGGHWWNLGLCEIDGEDEARRMTRRQLKAGADVIKVMASRAGSAKRQPGGEELTIGEMSAICEEAHKQSVRVSAHAVGAESVKNAVLAGVDTIEHGCFCDNEGLEMMMDKGIFLVTTLFAYHRQAVRSSEVGWPEHVACRSQEVMEIYAETIRRALRLGVCIVPGSDAGQAFITPHGENAGELVLLCELAGLDPMTVLCLSTYEAARALGLEAQVGSIEEGKVADVVVLSVNPCADIGRLRSPDAFRAIISGGKVVHCPERFLHQCGSGDASGPISGPVEG